MTSKNDLQFYYLKDENSYIFAGYHGNNNEVIIPSIHNGLPVIGTTRGILFGCENIKRITFPDSIQWINIYSFDGYNAPLTVNVANIDLLKNVELPDGCVIIDRSTLNEVKL